ncbi:MAG: hypothetical protein J6V48_08105 [Clostridia bacterium]|jgi:5'(3')-deoxyribonucleotidase|nr:hypothetical protein [Clostridia bacterium]
MRILVDMDDTIERLLDAWLKVANERYGTDVAYDDVRSWNVTEAFPGLTPEQIYGLPKEPGFWKNVKPMPGAPEALKRFIDAGHEVYVVTATQFCVVPEKMTEVLFRYFPFLTQKQVIITYNKQMIKGDVLIDDGPHNLEGGDYIKILMTAPHNRSYDAEAHGMIRVGSWPEIESVIEKLAAGG